MLDKYHRYRILEVRKKAPCYIHHHENHLNHLKLADTLIHSVCNTDFVDVNLHQLEKKSKLF